MNYFAIGILFVSLLASCSTVIESQLSEDQADRAVQALTKVGIPAKKNLNATPRHDKRYQISVNSRHTQRALALLKHLHLFSNHLNHSAIPAKTRTSFLNRIGKDKNEPEETASKLEQSLISIDGVLDARVHLARDQTKQWNDDSLPESSASVLIQYQRLNASLSEEKVKQFVANAVGGLNPNRVTVFLLAVRQGTAQAQPLRWVGPFEVTAGTAVILQWALALLLGTCLVLASALVILWRTNRRLGQSRKHLALLD